MEIVGKDEHQQEDRSLVQCLNPVMIDTPVVCGQNQWCDHSTNESWDCDELPQSPSPQNTPQSLNTQSSLEKGHVQILPHSPAAPWCHCCHEEWYHKPALKQHYLQEWNKQSSHQQEIIWQCGCLLPTALLWWAHNIWHWPSSRESLSLCFLLLSTRDAT